MPLPSYLMEAVRARQGPRPSMAGTRRERPLVPVPEAPMELPRAMMPPPSDMTANTSYGLDQVPRSEAMRRQVAYSGQGVTQFQPRDPVDLARQQDMILRAIRELIGRS